MKAATASRASPTEQLIDAAREIAPRLKERTFEAERLRTIPPETIAEFKAAGLFRAVQPARFGGYDMPVSKYRSMVYEFAQYCGSTAWVLAVLGGFSRVIGTLLPIEAQEDLWGATPEALSINVLAPNGVATPHKDGYLVSGRWGYGSGADFAQWAVVGAKIEGKQLPPGAVAWGMLVPMSEAKIIDDWQVLGLVATGSKSIEVKDVYVPAHRIGPVFPPMGSGGPYGFATIGAGIARGAVRRFLEHLQTKPTLLRNWTADSDGLQARVSESAAEADAAWAMISRDCAEIEDMNWDTDVPMEVRARNRRNAAYAMLLSVRSVERLYLTANAAVTYSSNLLQQSFRDVHTATMHMSMHWDSAAVDAGKALIALKGEKVF